MALADLIRKETPGGLEEILATLGVDDDVEFEEDSNSPKFIQVFPAAAHHGLPPVQGITEELILSAADIDDALGLVQQIADDGNLFTGLSLKNSCREAVFIDEEKGMQVISFSDVSTQAQANGWSLHFMQGLIRGLETAKKVVAKLLDNAKVLMISGSAREVGESRDDFSRSMRLADLEVAWETGKNSSQDVAILKGYGLRTLPGEESHLAFIFDAISTIPQEHRRAALQIIVDHCLGEYSLIDSVVADIKSRFQDRPEFPRIQQILDRYEMDEENLRDVLTHSSSTARLDPGGSLLAALNEKASLVGLAKQSQKILEGALREAVSRDNSLSNIASDKPAGSSSRTFLEMPGYW